MADTYKGDSPAKKVVRAKFWGSAVGEIGFERATNGRFAFLVGRECGDVRALSGIGIHRSRMIGIERDEEAYYRALDREPFVDIRMGDIEKVLCTNEFRRSLDVVLIDTCSPLSDELARKAARIAAYAVKEGGILGIGCMVGRERSTSVRSSVSKLAKQAQRFAEEIVGPDAEGLLREGYLITERNTGLSFEDYKAKVLEGARRTMNGENTGIARMVRVAALEAALRDEAAAFRTGLSATWSVNYQSSTRGGRGVPMLYASFKVFRAGGNRRDNREAVRHAWRREVKDVEIGRDELINDPNYWEQEVKEVALNIYDQTQDSQRAADMVNVSRGTVLAWIAHRTRALRRGVDGARYEIDGNMETFAVWYPEELTDAEFLDRAAERAKDPNAMWHADHINRLCDMLGAPERKITTEFGTVHNPEAIIQLIEMARRER